MSRAAGRNRRDRSTDAHPAHRRVPPRSTAPRRASRARAISREEAATRSLPSCFADGRTALQSFALVMICHQTIQEADAVAASPALVDVGLRRAHGGAGDVEMRPGRAVDEALEELRRGDRAAMAAAGVFHVGELGIDQLVVFGAERQAPDLLAAL